jgi:hypothetical protein
MIRTRHVDRLGWWKIQAGVDACFSPLARVVCVFLCFHRNTAHEYKLFTVAKFHKSSVHKTSDTCVCEIPQHGHRHTAHLRFSLYSYKCCIWKFLSFYTDCWICIMRRSWSYLTTQTSYFLKICRVLQNKQCRIYNGYALTLHTKSSKKKKLPTFLSQHIEYLIQHVPYTASNTSSIFACVFVAARLCLPSQCQGMLGRGEFTDSKVIS